LDFAKIRPLIGAGQTLLTQPSLGYYHGQLKQKAEHHPMTSTVNAEIIAIGTEILLGEITDTNSVYIARMLRDIGLNLYYMTSVGDNEVRIADVIRTALSRAEVVITCGGLGPTVDDMTRQAVAAATQRGLTYHPELMDEIAKRFVSFRAQMTENNSRQAYLPDNAIVIENPVGTAPSFIVEHQDRVVISLPGVPREMKYLMTERVIPYLQDRYQLGSNIIKARILRTAGIGESALDAQIGDALLQSSNPTVGLAAHSGQVDVRITAKADSEAEANAMIEPIEAQIRERVGQYIFGVDNERIEDALFQILAAKQLKLAVSQTGIGNPVGEILSTLDNAGEILVKVQTYADLPDLYRDINISTPIPIQEVAEQAAEAICLQNNASAGIAIVSQPQMNEFHSDSEGGTAFAVYFDGKRRSRVYGFGGQSDVARDWSKTWSLSMLWRLLREKFAD
jgi:nicotinamide-nucleotide amidase